MGVRAFSAATGSYTRSRAPAAFNAHRRSPYFPTTNLPFSPPKRYNCSRKGGDSVPEFNDEIWKRSIHTLFRPMIEFHFPDLYPLIDWSREPAFLEK